MWMYFLLCLFAYALLAASENTTTNTPWPSAESDRVSSTKLVEATTSPSRRGYERDVLVVLPVMQGNSDLTNSNLQMLYTKTPVTAIINEQPEIRSSSDSKKSTTAMGMTSTSTIAPVSTVSTPAYSIPPVTIKHTAQSIPAAPLIKRDHSRHPYTDFLLTKSTPKAHKSPLDYGYPESFKFVQELNELPKNHKPEWAQSELAEAESKKSTTTEGSTKGNPFQMFESVKPLEINKLLSLKAVAIPVTDSIFEEIAMKKKQETTETPNRATKRPFNKRPNKKPQKVKLNPQKLSEVELAPFIPFMMTSTDKVSTNFDLQSTTQATSSLPSTTAEISTSTQTIQQSSTAKSEGELYDIVRYSTLFAQSNKMFLPTPYVSSDRVVIRPIKSSTLGESSSESWTPMTSPLTTITTTTARPTSTSTTTTTTTTTTTAAPTTSIPTSTTFSPSINWANVNAIIAPIMETTTPKIVPQVKPSDLISLSKILDEHFDKKEVQSILQTTTAKPHFPAEMLTNEMKNMLIALGLLKPEPGSSAPLLLVTNTPTLSSTDSQHWDNLFVKREPVTPTIDPDSYTNFKKLPIDHEKPQVSNDMRDLLSSFGLLPSTKSAHLGTNSILTRISRHQKQHTSDHSMDMLDDKMRETLENLGLMKPMAYQMNREGHVFQPSMHLEKLADAQQKEKINSALATIRMLSKSKDVQNLPIEELEQRLRNATALLRDEIFLERNVTDAPEPTTKLFSTTKNLILHSTRTTVAQQENSTASHGTTPLTIDRSTPTTSFDTSSTTSSTTISFFRRRNNSSTSNANINSRKRGSTRFTTTANSPSIDFTASSTITTITPSTTTTTTSTLPPTIISTRGTTKSEKNSADIFTTLSTTFSKSPFITTYTTPSTTTSKTTTTTPSTTTSKTTITTPSTTTSTTPSTTTSTTSIFTKVVAASTSPESTTKSVEVIITSATNGASSSSVTPATISLFPEEHNEVNYTPAASSVSLVTLSHIKNDTKVVMSPPPNPLSIEELQYLLESNRNDVKRQQPQDTSTSSTTTSSTNADSVQNNTSTTADASVGKNSKTSNDSITDSTSSESSNASSTTSSNGDTVDTSNGITEESAIKDDDSGNNAPLEALADSFGGENEEQVDSWQANAKPNGLYFLLDWNTFLSVGEEDKRPIRIRFSPRAGNPRNFMPIKVP